MPETQAPPATGEAGDGTSQTETSEQAGNATQQGAAGENSQKTFTQADVDRIVQDRVARAKPEDYDEAKTALEEKRRREEGEKTELQKAKEREERLKAERDSARTEATKSRIEAAIQIEALRQGADEEMVALALAGDKSITVGDDGKVVGVQEAVEALLERKPNLKTGGVRQSAGEFGGNDGTTVNEQIKALEAKGDPESLREARAMKIAASLGQG